MKNSDTINKNILKNVRRNIPMGGGKKEYSNEEIDGMSKGEIFDHWLQW